MGRLFAGTPFDIPPRCDRCGLLEKECRCAPLPATRIAPEKQRIVVYLEKRKKGKVVTVAEGFQEHKENLEPLLTKLKNACGAGGTIQDQAIEVQGDHLKRVESLLSGLQYKVRVR